MCSLVDCSEFESHRSPDFKIGVNPFLTRFPCQNKKEMFVHRHIDGHTADRCITGGIPKTPNILSYSNNVFVRKYNSRYLLIN